MFDSWAGDLTDRVAAGVLAKLWTLLLMLLGGIGWGTILMAVGALLALILLFKILSNTRVLIVLVVVCLVGGYCLSRGVSFDTLSNYVTGGSDTPEINVRSYK